MAQWLEGSRPPMAPAGERFARLLETRSIVGVPGAHDSLSAILAEKAGSGADVVFPEALEDDAAFRAFAEAIEVPLLANMTEFGKTPHRTLGQFEALGFRLVIWPVSSLRVAAKAVADLYAHIGREGGTEGFLDRMQPRAELYETIGYHAYESLDGSIARSILPETPKGGSGEE